jgi:hypothetical protein
LLAKIIGFDINFFLLSGFLFDNGEVDRSLVNKMTDISEDMVERLADGIPAIITEDAEVLVQYIANQIAKIVANYRTHP